MPVSVLVTYIPKPGCEDRLAALVRRHGEVMPATGLLGPDGIRAWRALSRDGQGPVRFVELMQWRDEAASDLAHQDPAVMSVWEPMAELLQELIINPLAPLTAG